MASVIDDVLQLAETESLGVEYVPVQMVDVIEEAVKPLEEIAIRSDIELERGTLADVEVLADRQQLVSAVRNLIRNAITYTAAKNEPGTVIYRARSDDDFVRIEIEDTGIGIPSRYTDRVFERFFRVDRARSRESGGTGLGLSIVRTVAVAHGGTVDVSSRVGVGSTFTIRLPTIAEE
jgi:signal transduction histidine kinase